MNDIKLYPINEIGNSRTGTLVASYNRILEIVGKPNVTDLDDHDKVHASWAYESNDGRKIFIWSYKVPKYAVEMNTLWSIDGNIGLFTQLFGENEVDA